MAKLKRGDRIKVVPLRQTNRGWYLCPVPLRLSRDNVKIPKDLFERENGELGEPVVVEVGKSKNGYRTALSVVASKSNIDHSVVDFGNRVFEKKDTSIKSEHNSSPNRLARSNEDVSSDENSTSNGLAEMRGENKFNVSEKLEENNVITTSGSATDKQNPTELDVDLNELRKQAEEAAVEEVPKEPVTTNPSAPQYHRSQVVKKYAKARADGICEGCEEPAPFISISGEPYLHIHHIHELSDGGSDTPDTVAALCPNCHYRVHHGEDGSEFNKEMMQKIKTIEK